MKLIVGGLLLILIVGLAFVGCAKKTAVLPPDAIIDPAVGIGVVHFGDSLAEVESKIGAPSTKVGTALEYHDQGFAVMSRRGSDKVAILMFGDVNGGKLTEHCRFKLPDGIVIGSSRIDVVARRGEPEKAQLDDAQHERLFYNNGKLVLSLLNGKVVHMEVHQP
jgi:hypothetical protein